MLQQSLDSTKMAGMLGNIAAFGIRMNQAEGYMPCRHVKSLSVLVFQPVLCTLLAR